MSHEQHTEHAEHGGPKLYTRNLIVLLILTAITVGASYVDFGAANVVIALFIASIKATLVALFFMHLISERQVIFLILALTGIFAVVLLMLPAVTNLDHIAIGH